MAYKDFFGHGFLERPMRFSHPDSCWVLIEKVGQRHTQLLPEEVLERPYAHSTAYGTFLAKSIDDESQQAFIRVILQIPYAGGEIASPEERARQAVDTVPERAQDMLDALTALTDAQSQSAPRLLGVSSGIQGQDGPVPGGYMTCLLLEKLPGKRVGPWFWELDLQQRDNIRAHFKQAWIDCATIGKYQLTAGPEKVFWDDATQRIAFYDFLTGCREDGPIPWKDMEFLFFELAKAPPQYRMWAKHTEKSRTEGWTF